METLQLERSEGVATITLNRPKVKNAMNAELWEELSRVLDEIAKNTADRAVVITGAGGDFCSGADLGGGGPFSGEQHASFVMAHINEIPLKLHRLPKPTIAKVRGVAAGAGLNLALGCDLVVASDNARFSEIFAQRGLVLDFGGSWLLPRLIGLHRAKEVALFGDVLPATEADRLGLVNRVVPDDELDGFVTGWARRLAAGPPVALAQTKRMLNESFQRSMAEALDAEGNAQVLAIGTDDVKEAVKAFLQKRTPTFEGR
ncbi:MAG: enoyl-CoA hydratase [Acidimicrobiales bacterium]|nr:enoyl-CoA hydratase [Acidimicrobiales bacterium]